MFNINIIGTITTLCKVWNTLIISRKPEIMIFLYSVVVGRKYLFWNLFPFSYCYNSTRSTNSNIFLLLLIIISVLLFRELHIHVFTYFYIHLIIWKVIFWQIRNSARYYIRQDASHTNFIIFTYIFTLF